MSTIIRRRRASRMQMGPYKRHELLTGEIKYPAQGYSGYGDGRSADLTEFISDPGADLGQQSRGADCLLEFGSVTGHFPGLLAMALWVREGGLSALGGEAFGLKGRASQRGKL